MKPPKVSKDNVEQTIDLEELFGVTFKGRRDLREIIGQLVIDRIVERTRSGTGIRFSDESGRPYSLSSIPYSEEYALRKKEITGGKKVDLTLFGDMLDTIDVIKQTDDTITVGWNDDLQRTKAYAHTKGNEGDSTVKVPARPFFGVNKTELAAIRKELKNDVEEILETKEKKKQRALILDLIDEHTE